MNVRRQTADIFPGGSLYHHGSRNSHHETLIAQLQDPHSIGLTFLILTCICRLAPEKGFQFLAQVAEKLVEAGLNYKLLIVGGNRNPAVEKEIHNMFKNVKDRVIFPGFLAGTDLARAYAAADLFLHCWHLLCLCRINRQQVPCTNQIHLCHFSQPC